MRWLNICRTISHSLKFHYFILSMIHSTTSHIIFFSLHKEMCLFFRIDAYHDFDAMLFWFVHYWAYRPSLKLPSSSIPFPSQASSSSKLFSEPEIFPRIPFDVPFEWVGIPVYDLPLLPLEDFGRNIGPPGFGFFTFLPDGSILTLFPSGKIPSISSLMEYWISDWLC